MSVYTVYHMRGDEIVKVHLFVGQKDETGEGAFTDYNALFEAEPTLPLFKTLIPNLHELQEMKIPIQFVPVSIYIDDRIETIKCKIIAAMDRAYALEEVYLFAQKQKHLNTINIYNTLSQNGKQEISRDRLVSFLSNISDIGDVLESLPVKSAYDYDDLLSLQFDTGSHLVRVAVGQSFRGEKSIPFTVNPFDVTMVDRFVEQHASDLMSTQNDALLMESLPLHDNVIYVCLCPEVMAYMDENHLPLETMFKVYFPFLFHKGIVSPETYNKLIPSLTDHTSRFLDSRKYINYTSSISMFHELYSDQSIAPPYVTRGIRSLHFYMHPAYATNIPLDVIFKLLNTDITVPLAKYNPGPRSDKLYRLYAPKLASNGSKIPYLPKSTIVRLHKRLSGGKRVSGFAQVPYQGHDIDIICNFLSNGSLLVEVDGRGAVIEESKLETILQETVNPIIYKVRYFIQQSGYDYPLFSSLYEPNIEVNNMEYAFVFNMDSEFSLTPFISCLSSVFHIEPSKKELMMRFKKVAYFNEMDSMDALIIKAYKHYRSLSEIRAHLVDSFPHMTETEAGDKIRQFLSDVQTEQSIFENRKLRIKANPGFPVKVQQDRYSNAVSLIVSDIDSVYYLSTLPVYIAALYTLTQGTYEQSIYRIVVDKLCRGRSDIEEAKIHKKDIGQTAVEALPTALIFEGRDGSKMTDILFGDYDEDDEEDEEEEKGEEEDEEDDEEDEEVDLGDIVIGEMMDEPILQEDVSPGDYDSESDDENEGDEIEFGEVIDDGIELGTVLDEPSMTGGARTPRKLIGTKLRSPNYFQKRLHDRDPELFLTTDDGKYSSYSRLCMSNIRRQPIILTDEEKKEIDKHHRDAYTSSVRYGSSPDKQFHYICPRYWCMTDGVPLTHKDVEEGKCGGKVIDFSAEEVTEDSGYIYEFRARRQGEHEAKTKFIPQRRADETEEEFAARKDMIEHEAKDGDYYHWHAPGFTKDDSHPEGKCVPCCFKIPKNDESKWPSAGLKERIDRCEASSAATGEPLRETPRTISAKTAYVMGPEKMPLPNQRWGYIPITLQKFFQFDCKQCYFPEDPKIIKPGVKCILRRGVESSQKQSFVACLANLYGTLTESPTTIANMKEAIIQSMDLRQFAGYQNGNLVSDFATRGANVSVGSYKKDPLYKEMDMKDAAQKAYFHNVVNAYSNFCDFMRSDTDIDYTYLWDIVCTPNDRLFATGLNLVVLEIPEDDITANVELVCPTNAYGTTNFVRDKPTFIVFKKSDFFEPIFVYNSSTQEQMRLFMFPYKKEPRHIRRVLRAVKRIYARKCAPLPSLTKNVYRFRSNIPVQTSLAIMRKAGYGVDTQVLNYNSKCIGLVAGKDKMRGYVPVSPSGLLTDLPFQFVDSLDGVWKSYEDTVSFLRKVNADTAGAIPCRPLIKVVSEGLVIGLLTETNQLVLVDPPEPPENSAADGLKTQDELNSFIVDKTAILADAPDKERIAQVHLIRLESQFFSAFRNTVRIMLNKSAYYQVRKDIEAVLHSRQLYANKLRNIEALLRTLVDDQVEFANYSTKMALAIPTVTNCIAGNEDTCSESPFCVTSRDTCKLVLPSKHLVSKANNTKGYFSKLADEFVRYGYIRNFMLKNKSYLTFQPVKYNLGPDEIMLLESQMTQEYFDNLVPLRMNRYVDHIPYDATNPSHGIQYDNEISLEEFYQSDQEMDKASSSAEACVSKRHVMERKKKWLRLKLLPAHTMEQWYQDTPICSFQMMVDIASSHTGKAHTVMEIKQMLVSLYSLYRGAQARKLQKIFIDQKKRRFATSLREGMEAEAIVMSDQYYLTNIDVWVLSVHMNLPIVLVSSMEHGLPENGKDIFNLLGRVEEKVYIVNKPGYKVDSVASYMIYCPRDSLYFEYKSLPPAMRTRIQDASVPHLEDYVASFDVPVARNNRPAKTSRTVVL